MAELDSDTWYRFIASDGFIVGPALGNDTGLSIPYWKHTLQDDDFYFWQFFPFNTTYYVLRSKADDQGFLNARIEDVETNMPTAIVGNTGTHMANSTLSDDSVFWQIKPRDDGTFYMTNAANGTSWHLDSDGWLWMNSNFTGRDSNQYFTFKGLGKIGDEKYSSVVVSCFGAYFEEKS